MHRRMREQIEEVLAGSPDASRQQHLDECAECREEIAGMREQAAWLRDLRAPSGIGPRPGFYARVMERIEAQGAVSIWSLVFDSAFGRRIAVAAMALALLMGVYVVSSEQSADQAVVITGQPDPVLPDGLSAAMLAGSSNQDAVLVNLVTYQEQ
jgi:predicted anti-sigma-YlaC factor YlaD